ncbi:hypothetical protein NDA16_003345 [Ustilago loliicola]|nr:hypothetical protein NDA16_003345 [Ustilago loliicola]
MAPEYDALSDGSDLTGEDSSQHSDHDEEAMLSAPHTPSKKRRRLVRAVQDEDDEEDQDEVADQLDDDDDDEDAMIEEDNDELEEDEDEYDAPSSSRKGARSSGRRATTTRAAATPKRSARTSTRTAATAATPPTASAKKSLRVKLTRTPNTAAAAKEESSSPAPAAAKGRLSRTAATSAATPPTRKPKDASKVKWKPRAKAKQSEDEDEDEIIRTPSEDEQFDIDPSRSSTVDPDAGSNSPGSDSEPDEATAAEMQAIIGKTARQLAREGGVESEHMELPMFDPNRKKKLTENEIALRRSETARKRKNQVEKKLEDDKVETINRLLKKQVGRSRNKLPRAGSGEDSDEEAEQARKRGREELSRKALKEMPAPFFRFIDRADGSKPLAVPTGPPLVEEVWGSNYVEVNQALIQELDTPVKTERLSEKAKLLEEKTRKRLKEQGEVWKEEQELEQVWGQEGLYEYKLRSALGQSRKDWIGSRWPPTPEKEAQAEEQQQEAEEEAEGDNDVDEEE